MNSISDKKIERHCIALKILHVMRFYLLFLILSVTQVFGSTTYSQSATLTLQMNNTTIEDVLNSIEEQTEFRFLYNKKIVNVEHKLMSLLQTEKSQMFWITYLKKPESLMRSATGKSF